MRHQHTYKSTSGVSLLLAMSLGMLVAGTVSPHFVHAETYSVEIDGTAYDIGYAATGIEVLGFEFDADWRLVAASVNATSSGTLQVTLDGNILDSVYANAADFQILIDGDDSSFAEAPGAVPPRTFTVSIPAGSELVEFIGLVDDRPSDGTTVDASSSTSVNPVSTETDEQAPEAPAPEPEDQAQAEMAPETPVPEPEEQPPVPEPEEQPPVPEPEDQAQAEMASETPVPEPEEQPPETEPKAPEPATPETDDQPETAQASGCGPGTVLQDGVCILIPDSDTPSDAPADTPSDKTSWIGLFYGAVGAFIIGGAIAGILGLASRRRRRNG